MIELVNDGTGLGFGIVGGKTTGVIVKTILPGGIADQGFEEEEQDAFDVSLMKNAQGFAITIAGYVGDKTSGPVKLCSEQEQQLMQKWKNELGACSQVFDPMDPLKTVIVIRSLVPNGIAEQDGCLLPGDRLMYVNNINLGSASLEEAVQALKGADLGTVRIGVAKPLPIDCSDLELSDEKAFEHHFLEEEEEEEEEVLQSMIAEHSSADLTYLMSGPASTQKSDGLRSSRERRWRRTGE
ncbi:patj homolog isoform X2 [Carassius auratus]|uniref:Patj homolog isoform X2 n=1 Tax=Carassius auratus TaxID=7957 RepID=A0A6P6PRB5_CARAU|nr:patj homolog isoform X2 [Carassius auratus]